MLHINRRGFDADFENGYFFLLILSSLRLISKKLPILGPMPENMQNRQFFAYTRFFFYKQHFYKQHEAEIGLFWRTKNGTVCVTNFMTALSIIIKTTRFFFYKQHFYKQHEAQIGLFWNTNIGK